MTNTAHNDDKYCTQWWFQTIYDDNEYCTLWWWTLYTMMMNTIYNDDEYCTQWFQIVHDDDDGYCIQWWFQTVPKDDECYPQNDDEYVHNYYYNY